ncbi:MAG: hypothetical protein ACLR8P_07365 [Clostridium fessum]
MASAFGAILVGIALATAIMSILPYGVLGVLFGRCADKNGILSMLAKAQHRCGTCQKTL